MRKGNININGIYYYYYNLILTIPRDWLIKVKTKPLSYRDFKWSEL